MMDANEKAKEILDVPLDCFGGADGGGDFVNFKAFLTDMIERADSGDRNAESIVDIARQYKRMILLANGKS